MTRRGQGTLILSPIADAPQRTHPRIQHAEVIRHNAIDVPHDHFVGAGASRVRGCLGGAKGRSHWFVL
ncbi:hypothetical protein ASE70_10200 [Sphingomonas sp. Leaf22]|nr:hypothetical protein ASE70_10200 [Sphingomonas sp. Leaf22]